MSQLDDVLKRAQAESLFITFHYQSSSLLSSLHIVPYSTCIEECEKPQKYLGKFVSHPCILSCEMVNFQPFKKVIVVNGVTIQNTKQTFVK